MSEVNESPLSEQQEHYSQSFMNTLWEVVGQYKDKLTAYEVVGILEGVKAKIEFDLNVRAANEEMMRKRKANQQRDPNAVSPIINKHGFPIE